MLLMIVLSEEFKLFDFLAVSRSGIQNFGAGEVLSALRLLVNHGRHPERPKNL